MILGFGILTSQLLQSNLENKPIVYFLDYIFSSHICFLGMWWVLQSGKQGMVKHSRLLFHREFYRWRACVILWIVVSVTTENCSLLISKLFMCINFWEAVFKLPAMDKRNLCCILDKYLIILCFYAACRYWSLHIQFHTESLWLWWLSEDSQWCKW